MNRVCIHALGTEYDCINGSHHVLYEAFGPYRWQQFLFFIIFLILYRILLNMFPPEKNKLINSRGPSLAEI